MKTRGGWRETPQAHQVEVRDVTEMSDEDLLARIRVLDNAIGPMIDLRPLD